MTLVLILLLASAALGLAIGPRYNVYMLVGSSPLVAVVSAAATRLNDFSFVEGTATTFACITVSQIAYLFVTWLHIDDAGASTGHPFERQMDENGQSDVSEKQSNQQLPPSHLPGRSTRGGCQ
jgi:hypothetical protein